MYQPAGGKAGSGRFEHTPGSTTGRPYRKSRAPSSMDVSKGDFVALHAEPSAAFYMADLGIMSNGSIAAALYTSLPPADHVGHCRDRTEGPDRRGSKDVARAANRRCSIAPLWVLLSGEV